MSIDHKSVARPAATAPKDGTMLRLLVNFEANSTEDTPEPAWTIGFNNLANDGQDFWHLAGWNWDHDEFTQGTGEVVGWLPMVNMPHQPEEAHPCWSCSKPVTMGRRAAADGNCPHCGAELDLEDWPPAQQQAEPVQLKVAANNWPKQCPITRRDFFMEIDGVPTYGGPYDSYTIPEMTGQPNQPWHERELFVRRYDHDFGSWVEDEFIPLRVIHEDVLMELEDAAKAGEDEPVELDDDDIISIADANGFDISTPEGVIELCKAVASRARQLRTNSRRVDSRLAAWRPPAPHRAARHARRRAERRCSVKRYQYLVAYYFQGGVGRTFVTCIEPIDSDARVESVERSIRGSNGIDNVAMMSFQLLRSYDDGAGDCTAAQDDPRQAFAERHLGKPFAAPVPTIKLGLYGRAFDTPQTRRAYTYQHQPDNLDAGKLGRAAASTSPGGDSIDHGLSLLKELQAHGFGVFELGDQQEGGA